MEESRGGVVLIDEVENGLHYENLQNTWHSIAAMLRSSEGSKKGKIQAFITSHNEECVEEALTVLRDDEVKAFRIEGGVHRAKTEVTEMTRAQALRAIKQGYEIR